MAPNVKVSTASGSREVPKEDADSEYEEVKVEEDPNESEDETWGSWKPSDCLAHLGFSKGEAEELVRTYSKGRAIESLEVFSVDEPPDQMRMEEGVCHSRQWVCGDLLSRKLGARV